MQKPTLLILTFSIFQLFSFSQSSKIDSLEAQFKNHPDDVSTEFEIGVYHYKKGDYDKSIIALKDVAEKAAQKKNNPLLSKAYTNIGNVFADKGENTNALEFYQKALKIAESSSDKKNTASLLKNIGILYVTWIKFPEALDY